MSHWSTITKKKCIWSITSIENYIHKQGHGDKIVHARTQNMVSIGLKQNYNKRKEKKDCYTVILSHISGHKLIDILSKRSVFKKVPQKGLGVRWEFMCQATEPGQARAESDRTRLCTEQLVRSALFTFGLFAVISILLSYNLFWLSLFSALSLAWAGVGAEGYDHAGHVVTSCPISWGVRGQTVVQQLEKRTHWVRGTHHNLAALTWMLAQP